MGCRRNLQLLDFMTLMQDQFQSDNNKLLLPLDSTFRIQLLRRYISHAWIHEYEHNVVNLGFDYIYLLVKFDDDTAILMYFDLGYDTMMDDALNDDVIYLRNTSQVQIRSHLVSKKTKRLLLSYRSSDEAIYNCLQRTNNTNSVAYIKCVCYLLMVLSRISGIKLGIFTCIFCLEISVFNLKRPNHMIYHIKNIGADILFKCF